MNVLIDYGYREEDLSDLSVEELVDFVLHYEDCPEFTEVSVSFVDNDEIAALNEEYRGVSGPTDVLSFECDGADDEDFFPVALDEDLYELGDIIIAPDVAQRQCADFGTGFEQEISLLLVHGLLHLMGYDHIEDSDALIMQEKERNILSAWFALQGNADAAALPVDYEPIAARIVADSALPNHGEDGTDR